MGLEEQVTSAIRAETDRVPPWTPDVVSIRRSARSRTRRRAALGAVVATLAAAAMLNPGSLETLQRVDTAPPADVPEDQASALRFLGADEAVPPGRYSVEVPGVDPARLWVEMDVPNGFRTSQGRENYRSGPVAGTEKRLLGVSVWTITGVNLNPCHGRPLPALQRHVDPGPTVDDLAEALSAQPYRVGTPPRPVSIDGHDGLYLELRFTDGFDPDSCATEAYEAWVSVDPRTRARAERFWYTPHTVDRIWILDVDGTRIAVNAFYDERASAAQLAGLEAMLESLEIGTEDEQ